MLIFGVGVGMGMGMGMVYRMGMGRGWGLFFKMGMGRGWGLIFSMGMGMGMAFPAPPRPIATSTHNIFKSMRWLLRFWEDIRHPICFCFT
jgi:hypothetical protein